MSEPKDVQSENINGVAETPVTNASGGESAGAADDPKVVPAPEVEVLAESDKDQKDEADEGKEDGGDDDDDEEEETEYEIEAIIDAKRGMFPAGRLGYFVKWKGFASTDNSWVDELDAGNATDLITDYWSKQSQKKKRFSTDVAKTPKKGRQSRGGADNVDGETTSMTATKKRGRKSQTAESENGDAAAGEARATKKPRKSGAKKAIAVPSEDEDEEGEVKFNDLSEYKEILDWQPYIKQIDTVERLDDGKLVIYFTLKNGERARESSVIARARFNSMLMDFYEGNLRWKTAEEHAAEGP